jgi:predicted nucleic acid-binding protein
MPGAKVFLDTNVIIYAYYSFWDSLIIQAAIKGGASLLLSEDLSGGQTIRGVTIKNPF